MTKPALTNEQKATFKKEVEKIVGYSVSIQWPTDDTPFVLPKLKLNPKQKDAYAKLMNKLKNRTL